MVFNIKDMIAIPFFGIWVIAALIILLYFLFDLCRNFTTGARTSSESQVENPLLGSPHR